LNFEHHDTDTSTEKEAISPLPPPKNNATTAAKGSVGEIETPSKNPKMSEIPVNHRSFRSSATKILRGSIIDSDWKNNSSSNNNLDGSDIFYDAVQCGNSPYNRDAFLPESESPRESVVLAGVVVTTTTTSPINTPHRIDRTSGSGRHPNIETVLRSNHNDDGNNSNSSSNIDINTNNDHPNHHLNKSVEYTEQEYVHRMTDRSTTTMDTNGHDDAISTMALPDHRYHNHSIHQQYPPPPPPPPEELPLRFLRAGKNDPVEGVRRYQATLQMRREQKIDTILREPSEKFHIIKQYYPHYCHYRGKNNEPCFYEQPPKTNLSALRKNGVTLDKLLRHYTMVTEYQWQYLERDDLARSIYIIDLDGIRMTDFVGEAVDFVKKASAFSAQHYPERAGYVFVINVPGWFKLIWNVVKPIIDEDTLKKIYILRGKEEIRNAMQERIPIEHIPPEYGGTSVPLGQSPQEITLAEWVQHNNTLAEQQRTVCSNYMQCQFCTWVPARSY
jgi:hypothetical protein